MRFGKRIQKCLIALSCAGLLAGQIAQAATPIRDVALLDSGILQGQVLDVHGTPQRAVEVAVLKDGTPISVGATDQEGHFAISGISAGVYEIATANGGAASYRVWAPRTAPPAAQDGVLVVVGDQVVRGGGFWGKEGGGKKGAWSWFANPVVMGLIVAGAIAIPLALDDAS